MKNKIRTFKLAADKKVRLHYKGPFIAYANIFGINIDEYFDRLPKDEQKAVVWHEVFHCKFTTGLFTSSGL